MNTVEMLRQFSFLTPFSNQQLEHIDEIAPRFRYKTGEAIFKIGDPSGAMYLILSGQVKIHRYDEKGGEIILSMMDAGRVFGELALLSNEPRMASVTTAVESEFLVIDRNLLMDTIAAASPEAILKLFSILGNQLRSVNERDKDQNRESKPGDNLKHDAPRTLDLNSDDARRALRDEMLRSKDGGYSKDYQVLIRKYLEKLEK